MGNKRPERLKGCYRSGALGELTITVPLRHKLPTSACLAATVIGDSVVESLFKEAPPWAVGLLRIILGRGIESTGIASNWTRI